MVDCATSVESLCVAIASGDDCDSLIQLIVREQSAMPITIVAADFTGDGRNEILVHTLPFGCGSCRNQHLYVLEGASILFERAVDDAEVTVRPPLPADGFWLKQPVRLDGEGLCCPSSYLEVFYQWNGESFEQGVPQ